LIASLKEYIAGNGIVACKLKIWSGRGCGVTAGDAECYGDAAMLDDK
jgi:hypothetical protein